MRTFHHIRSGSFLTCHFVRVKMPENYSENLGEDKNVGKSLQYKISENKLPKVQWSKKRIFQKSDILTKTVIFDRNGIKWTNQDSSCYFSSTWNQCCYFLPSHVLVLVVSLCWHPISSLQCSPTLLVLLYLLSKLVLGHLEQSSEFSFQVSHKLWVACPSWTAKIFRDQLKMFLF